MSPSSPLFQTALNLCSSALPRRGPLILVLVVGLSALGGFTAPVQAQLGLTLSASTSTTAYPITNASATEREAISTTLDRLQQAATNRDANALAFYNAGLPVDGAPIQVSTKTTHIAVAPLGALVRQVYKVTIQRNPEVTLSAGTHEFWLVRNDDNSFALSASHHFVAPPDAISTLKDIAAKEWQANSESDNEVLDLIAVRLGGRWIALRHEDWAGQVTSAQAQGQTTGAEGFLQQQMSSIPAGQAVIGHFFFQKGQSDWYGVGTAPNFSRRISPDADLLASKLRVRMLGTAYLSAQAQRDFGAALAGVNLWDEAADAYQKAELLEPGSVGDDKLKEAEANRARDPLKIVNQQVEQEKNVGLNAEHPQYLISALTREQQVQPDAIKALRLALEYSRLAEDDRSAAWERTASQIEAATGANPQDGSWSKLLHDDLAERRELSQIKPANVLRSSLFTVRVWPNDPSALSILAALEEARYTVYADFGIPMGNTEVLQWHNQSEFSDYTTRFTAQGGSEFVAALTLTKLVTTRSGPIVLGEEINSYPIPDESQSTFSTIAHEYGHVAVRQLSRARSVPVWLNEGIATSVEGGYEDYHSRVRRASNAGTLLSMREMLEWNVDGPRAFLAYSQANSMVDFMVAKWGKKSVLDILRLIGNDVNPDQAFKNVLGVSQYELWNRWSQEGIL